MLFDGKDPLECNMTIQNPCDMSEKIVILPDPSHALKKIRNSIHASGEAGQEGIKRHLVIEGHFVTWLIREEAFKWG